MGEIFDELNKLSHSDMLPLHMPGHKRQEEEEFFRRLYALDITEIEPFDNLHDAKGMIKRAEERAAGIWGAKESHFLVNGSTCGNLTAVFATVPDGGEILVARNCHTSIYHAIELRHLTAHYIYPDQEAEFGTCLGIRAGQVRDKMEEFPDSKAVVITSPTYEGFVSEIKEIADLCHEKGIPLIVDEAHGAHLGFDGYFPKSALKQGADLVVQSLHKTLPSMTQTAILHIRSDAFVDIGQVRKYLTYFQTTSPSYIFLLSIEHCLDVMEGKGKDLMAEYGARLEHFYEGIKDLQCVQVLTAECADRDPGKIVFRIKGKNGRELARELAEKFQIQYEMCTPEYVLLMTSLYDTDETFERLSASMETLEELEKEAACPQKEEMINSDLSVKTIKPDKSGKLDISNSLTYEDGNGSKKLPLNYNCKPETIYALFKAAGLSQRRIPCREAEGRICGKAVYLYPPGIPFILPGERFTGEILQYLAKCMESGFDVSGMEAGEVWIIEEGTKD